MTAIIKSDCGCSRTGHQMRETPEDRKKEHKILAVMAKEFECTYQKVETLGKYKIDAWLHTGSNVKAWVECKWLGKEGFYGVHVPKYIEGCRLSITAGIPFIYAFRVPGKVGYIVVHNGTEEAFSPKFTRCGGTEEGREKKWDDIEPMMMFPARHIKWVLGQ